MPLPPVSVPTKHKAPVEKEDKAKRTFFSKELKGMPDPDDFLHTSFWKARRDPLAGMKYADFAPDVGYPLGRKLPESGATSLPTLTRMKQDKIFKPSTFR